MGKRRTSDEICKSLKNSRSKLYRERTNLLKSQKSGKLSDKKISASNKKIKLLSNRIDKLASRIFKCGKNYAKLKKKRANLIRKVNVLKNKLKGNREMPKSERNKILTEITQLNSTIVDLGIGMGKDVMELKKGKLTFTEDDELGEVYEDVVIWQVKSKVEGLISGGSMKFLTINGETYSLDVNALSALWAIDDYVADVTASQRDKGVRTPTIQIVLNTITETITII
jgi:predicted RNase H-like nuclease (RuvC/YqgF family)